MMSWTDPGSDARSRLASLSNAPRDWALFLDIDGTLLDIAEHPDQVRVPPSLIADLERVAASLEGALGLVSGRSIAWIDRSFHPLRLPVAGQQGSEIRLAEGASATADATIDLGAARRLLQPLVGVDGIEVEDKGLTIAVHYRAAPDRAWAKKAIEQTLASLDTGIEAVGGRLVYEVKARGVSKGTGVARLAATPPFAERMPVYFGDDHTDEFAFREVLARGGIAVQVGPSQAPPGCLWIESPAETRRWLSGLFARAPEAIGA